MNRINVYICSSCGQHIVTADADPGTTPFFLACRATDGCDGRMRSQMYQVDQRLIPTHEWYKPKKLPKDRATREHVKNGGLLIRKIESR